VSVGALSGFPESASSLGAGHIAPKGVSRRCKDVALSMHHTSSRTPSIPVQQYSTDSP
jgi:hypothetical protein